MKVAFVGDYDEAEIVAAPIKVAKELYKQLQLLGVDVTFLTYFADGKKYNRFQKLFGKEGIDVNIKRLGIFPLIREIVKTKPEIIQLTNAASFYLVLFPLKNILNFKLSYIVHSVISYQLNHYNNYNRWQTFRFRIIEKLVNIFSDIQLILNKRDGRYLSLITKVDKNKIINFRNGTAICETIKKNFESNDKLRIVTVGNIKRKEKGIDFLINSLGKLQRKVVLTICNYYHQDIIETNIPNNIGISFREPLNNSELCNEFIRNDIFIAASLYEPFGLSLLEAMSTGVLVIVSDRVGLTEHFDSELSRLVYHHFDSIELNNRIRELMEISTTEKIALSKSEIEFSKQFTWLNSAKSVILNYKVLIEN